MKRPIAVLAAALLFALAPFPVHAALHEVSVGNYWFEDDATGARDPIAVNEGDQIRFTIRQAAYPPHSIVIDEYDIDSGQLLIFETYTTPPLDDPGTYKLYCRAHRARGHQTTLVVKAKASQSAPPATSPGTGASTPSPAKKNKAKATATPKAGATTPAAAVATPAATDTPVPAGVGQATDRREAPPDPDSLAGILGRDFGGDVPWTAAVWQGALAALPIAAACAYALRRERRRARA